MDCHIHDIKCQTNKNDFTVNKYVMIVACVNVTRCERYVMIVACVNVTRCERGLLARGLVVVCGVCGHQPGGAGPRQTAVVPQEV